MLVQPFEEHTFQNSRVVCAMIDGRRFYPLPLPSISIFSGLFFGANASESWISLNPELQEDTASLAECPWQIQGFLVWSTRLLFLGMAFFWPTTAAGICAYWLWSIQFSCQSGSCPEAFEEGFGWIRTQNACLLQNWLHLKFAHFARHGLKVVSPTCAG